MERTIKVTGRGKLSVAPDLAIIRMELRKTLPDHSDAMQKSAEATELLKKPLEKAGVKREEVKTIAFSVVPKFESRKDWNAYKEKLVGYEYVHTLQVSVDANDSMLGKCLNALSSGSLDPKISISYTVEDTESCKRKLIASAVNDAQHAALNIADAAGFALGAIISVDYSWSELSFISRPTDGGMRLKASGSDGGYPLPVHPDNIELTDTVTVVWTIA